MGLVGANGAGKTTLLKLLNGLLKPDAGRLTVRGRTAPLIALGSGFHPVLTGRENAEVNLAILGLRGQEIERCLPAVFAFAELEEVMDAPLRTYSSGMAARLGFACAIQTRPDLLLIDEVLAVGDLAFRNKCYRKLAELRREGTALILVSHNPHVVMSTCDRALYLRQGRLVMVDAPAVVMAKYEEDLTREPPDGFTGVPPPQRHLLRQSTPFSNPSDRTAVLTITDVYFRNGAGQVVETVTSGAPAALCVAVETREPLAGIGMGVIIRELMGERETVLSLTSGERALDVPAGRSEIRLHFPYVGLRGGSYVAKLAVGQCPLENMDAIEHFVFRVKAEPSGTHGLFHQPCVWEVVS